MLSDRAARPSELRHGGGTVRLDLHCLPGPHVLWAFIGLHQPSRSVTRVCLPAEGRGGRRRTELREILEKGERPQGGRNSMDKSIRVTGTQGTL